MTLEEVAARVEGVGALIPLTKGFYAIVDEADYEWLSRWRWYVNIVKEYATWQYKAARRTRTSTVYMHRAILDLPAGVNVDHTNGYPLDNRRANLRPATKSQNAGNCHVIRASSGYRGVRFHEKVGAWQARICVNYKHQHLGYWPTAEDAARAVDRALLIAFGAFANTNEMMRRLG